MILTKKEVEFIKNKIDKGQELLENRNWELVLRKLDTLELNSGYVDGEPEKGLNETGQFIEDLIDKIAYDDGDDNELIVTE